MEEIEFSWRLFEGRLSGSKNVLPDGLNWLCYFAGSSKSHRENSISFIFLESHHQVDMINVVKSSKQFFGYFNTLETYSVFIFPQDMSGPLQQALRHLSYSYLGMNGTIMGLFPLIDRLGGKEAWHSTHFS